MREPYRDGEVHVVSVKCSTCIFRPGNLMWLPEGRRDALVAENIEGGGALACHQTLDGDRAVCRGFFDLHKHDIPGLTVAERLGMIAFDPPINSEEVNSMADQKPRQKQRAHKESKHVHGSGGKFRRPIEVTRVKRDKNGRKTRYTEKVIVMVPGLSEVQKHLITRNYSEKRRQVVFPKTARGRS